MLLSACYAHHHFWQICMFEVLVSLTLLFSALGLLISLLVWRQKHAGADTSMFESSLRDVERYFERTERTVREELTRGREESNASVRQTRGELADALKSFADSFSQQLDKIVVGNERRLDAMRETMESRLTHLQSENGKRHDQMREDAVNGAAKAREEVTLSLKLFNEHITQSIDGLVTLQRTRSAELVAKMIEIAESNEKRLDAMRLAVEEKLKTIQDDNRRNLEQMRETVDEKLQGTLEKRLGESFKLVSERLEQVHRGLGEMQALAAGVGDLKRVLTNVKARGTFGEVQLGKLLEQVLVTGQFAKNVDITGNGERVEFAIRLPGRSGDNRQVWLPIDAKFPMEDYQRLIDAREQADADAEKTAGRQLESRIWECAATIKEKYCRPPQTTDFGILFLPTEGLFADVISRNGLAEGIQRELHIVISGPTTLWAILNSLEMGFQTLAIQQRTSEVWSCLAAVRTEFSGYVAVLEKVQKKLREASNTIDEDVARKARAVERQLRNIESSGGAKQMALALPDAELGFDQVVDDDGTTVRGASASEDSALKNAGSLF